MSGDRCAWDDAGDVRSGAGRFARKPQPCYKGSNHTGVTPCRSCLWQSRKDPNGTEETEKESSGEGCGPEASPSSQGFEEGCDAQEVAQGEREKDPPPPQGFSPEKGRQVRESSPSLKGESRALRLALFLLALA
jgi:hypothetical protein